MPRPMAKRIQAKIREYAADPSSQAANVKRLAGSDGVLRLRVGDWRVLFTDDGLVVAVEKIGPRGSVYGN